MDLDIYFVYKRDSLDIPSCQHTLDDILRMDCRDILEYIHKLHSCFRCGNERWHHKVMVRKDLELEALAVVLWMDNEILIFLFFNKEKNKFDKLMAFGKINSFKKSIFLKSKIIFTKTTTT